MHKRLLSWLLVLCLLLGCCSVAALADEPEAPAAEAGAAEATPAEAVIHTIVLSGQTATLDGEAIVEYDYAWHADPTNPVYTEKKNLPAEYHTGTEPTGEDAVYVAHDIIYFPQLPQEDFQRVNYDGDPVYAYYYPTDSEYADYIFAVLPADKGDFPSQMMHTEEEAYANPVLHITEAGTYVLEGEWNGQIWIDLGEGDADDNFTDETAKVTILLNGADVTCTVAPALVFYSVYECDNTWEDQESWSAEVDTSEAGANVIIADGTVNNFTGTNIYRMLKATFKKEGSTVQKKNWKVDGAFYSFRSMNIDGGELGDGVLNINAGFEGLDSELHLTINGGRVNVFAQDDGINVNEDDVSVVTVNGGCLHILSGLGAEGDGVDSNGYLVINGGTVISMANPRSDSGLDSDKGSYVNGGTVVALGSTMDWAESESQQVTINLQFAQSESAGSAIVLTDTEGSIVFAYDPSDDEVAGTQIRTYTGAVISCPNFQQGETYYLYLDGTLTGPDDMGVYPVDQITAYEGGIQQAYTGTDAGFGPGGMGGPGGPPPGDMGEMPEGFEPPEMGEGFEPPEGFGPPDMGELPEGFEPPEGGMFGGPPPMGMGEMPEGFEPPEGFEMGGMPPMGGMFGGEAGEAGEASIAFYMTDMVNRFSGITAAAEAAEAVELPFQDVSAEDSYYAAVAQLYAAGIMNGTSETTFDPDLPVTRAMAITVLGRLLDVEQTETDQFTDIEANSWYSGYLSWAVENGIIQGYGDGRFGPGDSLTAEQLGLILGRCAALMGADLDASILVGSDLTVSRGQLAELLAGFLG